MWTIDDNSLDLAVFCAAAAFPGAALSPRTQPSLRLAQSRPHPARESLRSRCDPGNFLVCVPERETRAGESKGGRQGREGSLLHALLKAVASRAYEQRTGWCAI